MKASIVIPAYNAERTIGNCLDSLRKQSLSGREYEIIVVDDGSSDGTKEIVKKKGARLIEAKHGGPAKARNLGAGKARGEVVVFTDADCIADREFLAEMLKPFEDKAVAGVQGRYKCRQKEIIARLVQLEIEQRYEKMQRQKYVDFIGSYAAAYRRNLFLGLGGFDASFPMASGEDTDFSFRVSEKGRKMVFNQKAVVWHLHPTSLWKYLKVKFFRAYWRALIYRKHKGKIIRDSYTSQAIKVQVLLLYGLILALLGAILMPFLLFTALLLLILLLLSTLHFAAWAAGRDREIGLVSPVFILLRTVFFGLGLAAGTLREMVK